MLIETVINRCLRLDPDTILRLSSLAGKVILIEITDWHLTFYVVPTQNGIQLLNQFDGKPDASIRGELCKLLQAKNALSISSKEIEFEGDIDLGQEIRDILRGMDIDWEEHLANIIGDVCAHHLGNIIRGGINWIKQTATTTQNNIREYIQEEINLLPPKEEVIDFFSEVDTIRNDIERADARVKRLLSKMEPR